LKKYEMMVILDPTKEENISAISQSVEKVLTDSGASELSFEDLGVKELAYSINKQKKGHYFLYKFSSEGSGNKDIEKKLNMNEDVFRYLIIRDESEKILKKIKDKSEARSLRKKEREAKKPRTKEDGDNRKHFKREEKA